MEACELRPTPEHPNAVGYERTVVRLHEMAPGDHVKTLPIEPRFLVFATDGQKLLMAETGASRCGGLSPGSPR